MLHILRVTHRAMELLGFERHLDIEPGIVADGAVAISERNDLPAVRFYEPRNLRTCVPCSLHRCGEPRERTMLIGKERIQYIERAVGGRGVAPKRTPAIDRLPRYHRGRWLPHYPLVFIEHHRHDVGVRIHVRSGHIGIGTQVFRERLHILARERMQVSGRELLRVDSDPALRAPEWDINHGTFDCHHRSERGHLVLVGVRVETYTALIRTAHVIELHPVCRERCSASCRKRDGEFGAQHAVRGLEPFAGLVR